MRTLPKGSTSAPPPTSRLDRPDDLEIKIHELREITDWQKPIFVKVGARALL
jgi:glutamate synthase domain-containing protein 2